MSTMKTGALVAVCCALLSSAAFAQTVQSLEEALENADPNLVADLQDGLEETSLSSAGGDLDSQTIVLSGLLDGQFTPAEAADLEEVLAVVNANSEYFDFDVAAEIQGAVAEGSITAAQAAESMRLFALLSPEAKAVIGSDAGWTPGSLEDFSAEDQEIICSAPFSNNSPGCSS